ncbi:pyrrolidone-carboxylate peptidase [Azospirillum sp. B510]|uniref:pyroglutamyl-peptidase I family protein n=1 Tax=Azospirillum sp. (strain B510) TaxID=137722 RepID=UPI0001C4C828|nr:pyrrolidone-carboxylate peptidase [Azospirillum sp. B510]BAI73451.1 pyrrolidone-carboxylate peptidase [Azospirillum sp. B510]
MPVTPPILITGFAPFGSFPDGASDQSPDHIQDHLPAHPWAADQTALLMERLAREPGVVTATLPPVYDVCGEVFAALLAEHRPLAALGFACLETSDYIRLERLAWNRDESPLPDATGTVREHADIVADGPTAYGSTLPVPRVMRELSMAGLPVTFGDFSGGFLGNHLFYRARHIIESAGLDVPYGFFHMPPLPERAAALRRFGGLSLERQELTVRTLVGMLRGALDGVA